MQCAQNSLCACYAVKGIFSWERAHKASPWQKVLAFTAPAGSTCPISPGFRYSARALWHTHNTMPILCCQDPQYTHRPWQLMAASREEHAEASGQKCWKRHLAHKPRQIPAATSIPGGQLQSTNTHANGVWRVIKNILLGIKMLRGTGTRFLQLHHELKTHLCRRSFSAFSEFRVRSFIRRNKKTNKLLAHRKHKNIHHDLVQRPRQKPESH